MNKIIRKGILFSFLGFLMSCSKETNNNGSVNPTSSQPEFQVSQKKSSGQEATRLGLFLHPGDFEATALYLPPNGVLKLSVESVSGNELPQLLIGTYSRYTTKNDPQEISLVNGENTITADSYGGLLYLRFVTNGNGSSKAKVVFKSGFKKVPHYVLGKTTSEDWKKQLAEYNTVPDVIMESKNTIRVLSLKNALLWKDINQEEVLNTADKIIDVENEISGLDGSSPIHQKSEHKLLMTQTDIKEYYMFATYYRTAFRETDALPYAFTSLIKTDGWGPWHEIGHMHQQASWTWNEVVEVTVNIYSLAVQRALGFSTSRLKEEKVWDRMNTFFAIPNRDYNDDNQADLFVRLCMFEQLRLAFGDNFYKTLHRQTRETPPTTATDKDKMKYFMKKACTISGRNLTTFFRKWGFKGVEDAFTEINNLGLPQPDKEPSTLTD